MIVMGVAIVSVLMTSGSVYGQQNDRGAVVGQNPDEHAPLSSSLQEPNQTTLPNAPSAAALYTPASELTLGDRFAIYRHTILRPYSIVGPAFGAGIGQWENEPPEWGQGAEGYGKRIASGMARQMISETIRFGFAAVVSEVNVSTTACSPRGHSWYPESRATTGYALRRGSTALASSLGFHLFQEFMPRRYFKRLGLGDETLPTK